MTIRSYGTVVNPQKGHVIPITADCNFKLALQRARFDLIGFAVVRQRAQHPQAAASSPLSFVLPSSYPTNNRKHCLLDQGRRQFAPSELKRN